MNTTAYAPKSGFSNGMQWALRDFHFIEQINTGGWAHKRNKLPSENLGFVNPDSALLCWRDMNLDYVTPTLYYALY